MGQVPVIERLPKIHLGGGGGRVAAEGQSRPPPHPTKSHGSTDGSPGASRRGGAHLGEGAVPLIRTPLFQHYVWTVDYLRNGVIFYLVTFFSELDIILQQINRSEQGWVFQKCLNSNPERNLILGPFFTQAFTLQLNVTQAGSVPDTEGNGGLKTQINAWIKTIESIS